MRFLAIRSWISRYITGMLRTKAAVLETAMSARARESLQTAGA